jgi:hypothetical protein
MSIGNYLDHKSEFTKEQQQQLEKSMEYYFDCTIECKDYDGKVVSSNTKAYTRKHIANVLGINTNIRGSYPLGYNYNIFGESSF